METKHVAVYCRTSKEFKGVEKISIPQQIEDGKRLAEAKNLGTAVEYLDADRSGKLPPQQLAEGQRKIREGLSALVTDIQAGRVHTVIVRKIDRLARGTELTLRLYRLFGAHKVRLMATDEQLPASDDDSGMFTLTVLAAAAEYELKKISSNIRRALAHSKRNGKKQGSARDLGFRDGEERGKVEIDTKSAEAVKEVFRRFIDGESQSSIAKWLTQTVAQWRGREGYGCGHVRRILQNPHYIGMR